MIGGVTDWRPTAQDIILLGAAVTVLAAGLRWLWRNAGKAVRWFGSKLNAELHEKVDVATVAANQPVLELLQRHEQRLERVEKEVTTNGGSSLKDLVIKFMGESSTDRGRLRQEIERLRGEVGRLEDLVTDHQLADHHTVPGEEP